MFERFTDRARRVLVLAQQEAAPRNHDFLGTEHILLGFAREGEGVAARVLERLNISWQDLQDKVEELSPRRAEPVVGSPPFTPSAKRSLEFAWREALALGHNYVGTEHLLLGMIRDPDNPGAQVLYGLGVEPSQVREEVMEMLSVHAYGAESGTPRTVRAVGTLFMDRDGRMLLAAGVDDSFPPRPTGSIEVLGLDVYVAGVQFESNGSRRWSRDLVVVSGTFLGDRLQATGPPVPLRALTDE